MEKGPTPFLNAENQNEPEKDLFKYWFKRIKKYTLLIVLCTLCALLAALVYNKIAPRIYQVSSSLVLKNNNNRLLDMQGLSSLSAIENQNLINNEIEQLKSALLIKRALKKLDFQVSYYEIESFKQLNIYHEAPFLVIPIDSCQIESTDFCYIRILNKYQYRIKSKSGEKDVVHTYHFGEKVLINHISFILLLKSDSVYFSNEYAFRFRSELENFNRFKDVKIAATPSSTVIKLISTGENPTELATFLNGLCREYLVKSIEKKSLISDKTLEFIESQLLEFSDSLKSSGLKLGGFKSSHQIMNIDQHSEQLFQSLDDLQKEKVKQIARLKYFEYLRKYVQNAENSEREIITPAIWGIDNEDLNKMIFSLIEAANERSELLNISAKNNPLLKNSETKIVDLKKQIVENANNLISITNSSIQNIDKQIAEISNKTTSLPKTQLEFFNYERMFKIYDELYTYLLTKRSEIQITKAGLVPENEIIDEADPISALLVAPDVKQNLILAFLLGLAIPIFIIILINYLSDKVNYAEDISALSHYPILGNVIHDNSKLAIPVIQAPKSALAESFRSIRTNFQFITEKDKHQIVLLTSSIMGEGKSFVSINIAASFAVTGKKTVVLYFDLRKKLGKIPFDIKNDIGLSNILCGNCSVSEAIKETDFPNLSIILPGALPPNPNELISSPFTEEMLAELSEKYDYVFIDTPPIGMFADALLLFPYTDVNLFLIRYAYSTQTTIRNIMTTFYQKNLKNVNLIVNDLPAKQSNYGYGYAYNYYQTEKRNIWYRMWHRIKQAV